MKLIEFIKRLSGKVKTKIQNGESPKVKRRYRISIIDCSSQKARKMCDDIKKKQEIGDAAATSALFDMFSSRYGIEDWEFFNLVPDAYLNSLAENQVTDPASLATADVLRLKYIGIGTSTSSPTSASTELGTEVFRKIVAAQYASGKTARTTMLVDYDEANGNVITEIGGFAGDTSATADSGTMCSHSSLPTSIDKTDQKAIAIEIATTYSSA